MRTLKVPENTGAHIATVFFGTFSGQTFWDSQGFWDFRDFFDMKKPGP